MSQIRDLEFQIEGMHCAEEVASLKKELGKLVDSDSQLSFDILNSVMTVRNVSGDLSTSELIQAVASTGMTARESSEVADHPGLDSGIFHQNRFRVIATTLSGVFLLVALVIHFGFDSSQFLWSLSAQRIFFSLAIFLGLIQIFPKAWLAAKKLRPDMHLLMTVAVIGAVLIGQWFEAAMIAFLFSISLMLEMWSIGRARQAVSELLDLAPTKANQKTNDGGIVEVSADSLQVGDEIIVRPGEKIPVDGHVSDGASDVNQAPITGESQPAEKRTGDEVFAGTINGRGQLEIVTSKKYDDSTLASIIRLVRESQSKRAESEKFVQRFAQVYTPIVMALALLIFVVPPLVDGQWLVWLYRSLVLLVIACPCALVISTPICVVAALASAARNGVLIKGGVFVELPGQISAMALDKTGTLTEGQLRVLEIVAADSLTENEVLRMIGAMEALSNHPIAKAIHDDAKHKGLDLPKVTNFEEIPGEGLRGEIDGRSIWIGSPRLLAKNNVDTKSLSTSFKRFLESGRSLVLLGSDQQVFGMIALADTIRPQAKQVVDQIHQLGIKSIVMLSGDNDAAAKLVGQNAGIDRIHSNLMPSDKVQFVEKLMTEFGDVVMVGDGINDAPALSRATVGISLSDIGSDIAIDSADIVLMSDDLYKLPWLIKHSRRTLSTIRQNIFFALGVKALLVVLTLVGYSSLWAAVLGDMGTSLIVIFNGLRLLKIGK